jgi:hypothetical protein
LNKAKKLNNDEFYTQYTTIEKELYHYDQHFKGKVIYCNCDEYTSSNFFKYFKNNYKRFELKKLIATHFTEDGGAEKAVFDGNKITIENIEGNGDFRSEEAVSILSEADVVVTNPPFSLFRDFVKLLIERDKDFIILGNINAVTYVDIFPHIKSGKILPGVNFNVSEDFKVPAEYEKLVKTKRNGEGELISTISNISWYTTLTHGKFKGLTPTMTFEKDSYCKYDNYDAVDVPKVESVPKNYEGVMGVPVNFLSNYDPKQYEILGSNRGVNQDETKYFGRSSFVEGKETYKRLFIKQK